jgi:hypothetical protein
VQLHFFPVRLGWLKKNYFCGMDILAGILDVLKYTIPAVVVLLATNMLIRNFLKADARKRQLELVSDVQNITLPLRLQAYERLVIYVERISFRNIISRLYSNDMTARDLQLAIVLSINTEFEHNLSQQVYVSKNVWNAVKGVKEQELHIVNRLADTLHPDAPARELYQRIIEAMTKAENELPTDTVLKIIDEEAKLILSYGTV